MGQPGQMAMPGMGMAPPAPMPMAMPPQGMNMEAFAQQEQDRVSAERIHADMLGRRQELHSFLKGWLSAAMSARKANYEVKWDRWRRNARNIYDPAKKTRKEEWQSTFFVPITMQNKEIIRGTLYRTLAAGLPYAVRPRPSGDADIADDIKDLLLRELQRCKFEVVAHDTFDDTTTYGTGFLKMFHSTRISRRFQRQPQYEEATFGALQRVMETGEPLRVTGYQRMPAAPAVTYRGIDAWFVSIWDIWFEEGAHSVQSGPHCQRYKMPFQDMLDGMKAGYFFMEGVEAHRHVEDSTPPQDKQAEQADLNLSQIVTPKQENWKQKWVYEWWGLLPKRLLHVWPGEEQLIDDPDELVPAKALFSSYGLLAVDANEDYCGESPFEAAGYLRVPNSVYHIGVAELLEQIQDDINETTNQRKDNVQLILNRMMAILERAIVSKADLVSKPGGVIRIKSMSTDDVTKAVSWVETPDVTRSSYEETFHSERFAQELVGANRVTIGSGGSNARDVTQTKGGMQLLAQSANERLQVYAMLIEADFIDRVLRRGWRLIYSNVQPEDVVKTLGPERAMRFLSRVPSPEDVDSDYQLMPEGVFGAMNQPIRIQQWQAFRDQYAGAPFFDDQYMARIMARAIDLPEADKVLIPLRDPQTGKQISFTMLQQLSLAAQLMSGNIQPPHGPGQARSENTKPRVPATKSGQNEPQERGMA